jgi:predicted nucleic acid-binding protein
MKSKFPSFEVPTTDVIADASVLINFLGTEIVGTLLAYLKRPLVMAEEAMGEVKRHPFPGANLAADLGRLRESGLVQVVQLGAIGRAHFYELTADDLMGGWDDGEAATIALAVERGDTSVVVLDEKKAARVLAERWPGRALTHSVMLLAQAQIRGSLSSTEFAKACCCALQHARMRVPAEAVEWMVDVIGSEQARTFTTLAKMLRTNR